MLTIWSLGWRPARAAGMLGSSESTWTGVSCILGTRPSWSREKLSGLPLDSMKMLGVDALAVVDEGEGDGLVEVEDGAVDDVVPGGVLDGVEVDDGVAGVDAGFGGGGVGGM